MAREWLKLIKIGVDPKAELAKARAANLRVRKFGDVLNEFLTRHVDQLASAKLTRQLFQREVPKQWLSRPVGDIRQEDCAAVIRAIVKRGHKTMAHVMHQNLRRFFSWAIGTGEFGLDKSPMEHLRPADLIGERGIRQRVLNDQELKAIWQASEQAGYPVAQIVNLLILTGQRLNDIARLSRSELHLDEKLIAIPAARMKSDRAHEVPLAPMALAILQATPKFKGPFIFSANGGRKPYAAWSKAKERLDKLSGVSGWVLHDLRRTFRTRIAAFQVSETVKELTIAHAIGGLHAVYDQHSYRQEKLQVFESWEALLAGIIGPPPERGVAAAQEDQPAEAQDRMTEGGLTRA